jgi:hypothetical protein
LGTGCESVSRIESPSSCVVVGKWKDGRIGSFRGLKQGKTYGVTVHGTNGVVHRSGFGGYEGAVRAICQFFADRKPPVSSEETIELFAFMEAADESKRRGGEPVEIAEVIQSAERRVGDLLKAE